MAQFWNQLQDGLRRYSVDVDAGTWRFALILILSPVHTSNNVEATLSNATS